MTPAQYTTLYQFVIGTASVWLILLLFRELFSRSIPRAEQPLTKLSVIVPYRNELKNLGRLVTSLKTTDVPGNMEIEIIFVDDQSDDRGEMEIPEVIQGFRVIKLKSAGEGKKAALLTGILQSKSQWILTWDADVTVPDGYFTQLSSVQLLPQIRLVALPVSMRSSTWFQMIEGFFSIEFRWLQSVGRYILLSGPVLANGANLLFRKNTFMAYTEAGTGQQQASGDDVFLLSFVQKTYGTSAAIATGNKCLTVNTQPPAGVREGVFQRLRWMRKSTFYGNKISLVLFGVVMYLASILAFIPVIAGITGAEVNDKLIYISLFFMGLMLVWTLALLIKYRECKNICAMPLILLFYPVYIFILITIGKWVKLKWKGRRIGD